MCSCQSNIDITTRKLNRNAVFEGYFICTIFSILLLICAKEAGETRCIFFLFRGGGKGGGTDLFNNFLKFQLHFTTNTSEYAMKLYKVHFGIKYSFSFFFSFLFFSNSIFLLLKLPVFAENSKSKYTMLSKYIIYS